MKTCRKSSISFEELDRRNAILIECFCCIQREEKPFFFTLLSEVRRPEEEEESLSPRGANVRGPRRHSLPASFGRRWATPTLFGSSRRCGSLAVPPLPRWPPSEGGLIGVFTARVTKQLTDSPLALSPDVGVVRLRSGPPRGKWPPPVPGGRGGGVVGLSSKTLLGFLEILFCFSSLDFVFGSIAGNDSRHFGIFFSWVNLGDRGFRVPLGARPPPSPPTGVTSNSGRGKDKCRLVPRCLFPVVCAARGSLGQLAFFRVGGGGAGVSKWLKNQCCRGPLS